MNPNEEQNSTPETALVPVESGLPVVSATETELIATCPEEMASCQQRLIQWARAKVMSVAAEAKELKEAFEHAVKAKWKSATLRRHAALCAKRVVFYQKMLGALEAGYCIVPNFPVTLFAIRTDSKRPATMFRTLSYEPRTTQESKVLPAGEGEYKNPEPKVWHSTPYKDAKGQEVYNWSTEGWQDMEFPANMARVEVMEATTRAMQWKIFDELGFFPSDRQRHADPVMIGRIISPVPVPYGEKRRISFMIAWHLSTKDL